MNIPKINPSIIYQVGVPSRSSGVHIVIFGKNKPTCMRFAIKKGNPPRWWLANTADYEHSELKKHLMACDPGACGITPEQWDMIRAAHTALNL